MGSHWLAAASTSSSSGGFGWFNYVFLLLIVVIIIFMWRNSRRRRRTQAELQDQFVVGAHVMTNFGLFGTIVSIDEQENRVVLEVSPGSTITVHRQVVTRVVEPTVPTDGAVEPTQPEVTASDESSEPDGEPKYGERITPPESSDAAPKKSDE